jgi:hypothetical protein
VDAARRSDEPDERIEFGGVIVELLTLGGLTVSRSIQPAGWRWRHDFHPSSVVTTHGPPRRRRSVGTTAIRTKEGVEYELGPGDLYDVDPGHDGYRELPWRAEHRWDRPTASSGRFVRPGEREGSSIASTRCRPLGLRRL